MLIYNRIGWFQVTARKHRVTNVARTMFLIGNSSKRESKWVLERNCLKWIPKKLLGSQEGRIVQKTYMCMKFHSKVVKNAFDYWHLLKNGSKKLFSTKNCKKMRPFQTKSLSTLVSSCHALDRPIYSIRCILCTHNICITHSHYIYGDSFNDMMECNIMCN